MSQLTWKVPPGFRAIPPRLNMADEIIDRPVRLGLADRPAIWHESGMLRREDLRRRVDAFARGLLKLGVQYGDHLLLRAANTPEICIAFFAAQKVGATPVLVNSVLGLREIEYIIENSGATFAIVSAESADPVREVQRRHGQFRSLVTIGDPEEKEERFDAVESTDSGPYPAFDTSRDDPALIVYSSGTTGRPKGIVHAHRWCVAVGDLGVIRTDYGPEDRVMATGELSFISALGHGLIWPLRAGCSAALFKGRAHPDAVLETCERLGVTALFSVPTFYRKVLAMPDVEHRYPALKLRHGNATGEPLGVATYHAWRQRFGNELYEYYGVSEFQVLTAHGPAVPVRPGSVGVPFPGVGLRVLDDELRQVSPGDEGYLSIPADDPGLFLGYKKDWERWRQMFRGPWYQPGDRFRQDSDGYLWHLGREDDFFKSRGIAISPAEIEAALMELEPVLEAAVVPQPDAEIGNAIRAVVVLRDGFVAPVSLGEELRKALRERIAPYKVPRSIEFVEELPHSVQGKVLRRALSDGS